MDFSVKYARSRVYVIVGSSRLNSLLIFYSLFLKFECIVQPNYYSKVPDPSRSTQRISFGTAGHRGSAFQTSFNKAHILAFEILNILLASSKKHRPLLKQHFAELVKVEKK